MATFEKHNVADILWEGPGSEMEVVHFSSSQVLSELYITSAQLKSSEKAIVFSDMLNKEASVVLKTGDHFDEDKYFSGIITSFHQLRTKHGNLPDSSKEIFTYEVEIRPKMWLLTKRKNTEVFQEKTAKDIIEDILGDHGIANKWNLKGSPRTREFCVQYFETDYAFISRLLEDEGITFFFNQKDKEVVFSDNPDGFPDCSPKYKIPYIEDSGNYFGYGAHEIISDFQCREEIGTGKFSVNHYNYRDSQVKMNKDKTNSDLPCLANLEVYDHRLPYRVADEGKTYVDFHVEEEYCKIKSASGHSSARSFETGNIMEMEGHFRDDCNAKWLLTSVSITAEQGSFKCYFTAFPADKPFRPARKTKKPKVEGLQTAVVTGPSGSKVYLDKMGRCKLQFHWDRTGEMNDRSSMWVRVSNGYAGKSYGIQWIPRVGHEVLVDFINSDPDLPIVTGRVYNDFNTAPLGPVNKWQNIIKDIKDNHIIFDAEDGKEEVNVRAQKNMTTQVVNNNSRSVGNDESVSVGHDRTDQVGNDENRQVGNNQNVQIGNDQNVKVGNNQNTQIGNNQNLDVGVNQVVQVGSNHSMKVGSNHTQEVGGKKGAKVGGTWTLVVGGNATMSVTGGNISNTASGSFTNKSTGKMAMTSSAKMSLGAPTIDVKGKTKVSLSAATVEVTAANINLTAGASSIKLNAAGVTIAGPIVTLQGLIKHNC